MPPKTMGSAIRWQFLPGLFAGLAVLTGQLAAIAQIPVVETGVEATAPLTPILVNSTYVLGPGDRLRMDVYNVPDYSREYQVLSDGTLSLPLIGVISVWGLTLEQANSEITNRYARFIRRPAVTLDLLQTRPLQIAIAGEVNRPGSYNVPTAGNGQDLGGTVTVTQAIKLAGGITQLADVREVQVRRPHLGSPGEFEIINVSLWALLSSGDLSQDVVLRDGDTVFVPTATAVNPNEIAEIATANFSPDVMTVNVVGEVNAPGVIEVPPNTPLNQALLAAGGFNTRAENDEVELVRLNPDGTATRRTVEVDFAGGVNEATNPALRPNDTIIVDRDGLNVVTDLLGTIIPPVGGIIRIINDIFETTETIQNITTSDEGE